MKTLPLRTSLTLWLVSLATGVVAVASGALFLGVRSALLRGLDAALTARAEGIGSLCEWEDGALELEGALEQSLDAPLSRGVAAVELRAWPGLELVRAHGDALPPVGAADVESGARTVGAMRVVSVVLPLAGSETLPNGSVGPAGYVLVRVGDSLAPMRGALLWLGGFALATLGAALLAVVGFGAFVGRRVVRPLAELLAQAAAAVRPGARARLPRRGVDDEVDRLSAVLEATFGALQAAMEEQRRFTADASHELRTPIAILQAETEIALRRERSPAELTALIARVHATTSRMGRMVEALLTLTRLDEGQPVASSRVDLTRLIEDAADALRVEATVTVHAPRAHEPHDVVGDEELLRMLLDNLLANAVRYACAGVRVSSEAFDGGLELVVEDDGPGVAEAERGRLFERFYRGLDARGHAGAGLGLALVAAIARAHGGRCRAEDAGPGLRIRVQLPASGA